MKQFIHILFAGAVSLLALSACVQVPVETPDSSDAAVQFTARIPETRTAFTSPEGDSYPVLWTANDSQVKIALNMISVEDAAVTPASDGKSATFAASFGTGISAPYSFSLLSPASAYDKVSGSCWEIKLRDTQTPTTQSVDEAAQILVAEAKGFSEMPQTVNFSLKHWTAYILLTVKNLDLGSAKVSAVELTAEKPLAGTWSYDTENASSTLIAGLNTIKAQTSSLDGVWFACAPADLSGTKLTVKVVTDAGNCVKEISLPDGRNLTSGTVARLTVDMAGVEPHVPGLKIERVWGKYSTAAASWNQYFGGTSNSDRNVAMDDENIYLAETNDTKNLWAISIADPATVKKLPVGTVKDEGTFRLSCPRVIRNSDAAINGGKDVLAVSNMTWGDPTLYFYSNGIESDPTVVKMPTWAERRLGDTYTVWGTLQDGMLFFKDFDNATAMMMFRLFGKVEGSNALQGRFVMTDGTGAGAYYPFPEDVKKGIYASRDNRKIWWVTTKSDPITATGGNECTLVQEESGYYTNVPSIQYIEWNGKRYVAYTRQVSATDGRLFILEGQASDGWQSIIQTRKVVYQAALQTDAAFQDGDYHPEMEAESPKASGNSGMDLAVREIGGAMYIAAVKQNVGLSLFKMTLE